MVVRSRSRTSCLRNLSKASLESFNSASTEGSTVPTDNFLGGNYHAQRTKGRDALFSSSVTTSSTTTQTRHVHFTKTTAETTNLEASNEQQHDLEEQVTFIPTLEELDVSDLYYTRDELREMGARAKFHASEARGLLRLLVLKASSSTSRPSCISRQQPSWPPTSYESFLPFYNDKKKTRTTPGWQTACSAMRGLEPIVLGDALVQQRRATIQRILAVQDEVALDAQQQVCVMRMRSLLASRKASHFAQCVGEADAVEAAKAI